jgi:hypothetical protein
MGSGGLAEGPRIEPVERSALGRKSPGRAEHRASHRDTFDVHPYSRACSTWAMTARLKASARWANSRVSTSR